MSAHAADPDAALLARLRAGDEQALRAPVQRYHAPMLRMARLHVRDAQADCVELGDIPPDGTEELLDALRRLLGKTLRRLTHRR